MTYGFAAHLAVDPGTGRPVAGATFEVWPDGQVGQGDALEVTDAQGVPILSLTSTDYGVLPVFRADEPVVVVTSGAYEAVLVAAEALVERAQAAAQAAADAAEQAASAAASAAQLAAAAGIPDAGTTPAGRSLVLAEGGAMTWGVPSLSAGDVAFTPSGTITATTVQGAVLQAAQSGAGGGTGPILVVQHTDDGYEVPADRPDGVVMVWFRGPAQPLWDTLPTWLADVDTIYDWRP